MAGRALQADNLAMDTLAGELAFRLVAFFLRPSSLVLFGLVSLALATGLASRAYLCVEGRFASETR